VLSKRIDQSALASLKEQVAKSAPKPSPPELPEVQLQRAAMAASEAQSKYDGALDWVKKAQQQLDNATNYLQDMSAALAAAEAAEEEVRANLAPRPKTAPQVTHGKQGIDLMALLEGGAIQITEGDLLQLNVGLEELDDGAEAVIEQWNNRKQQLGEFIQKLVQDHFTPMAAQVKAEIESLREQKARLVSHKRKKANDGQAAAGAPAATPEGSPGAAGAAPPAAQSQAQEPHAAATVSREAEAATKSRVDARTAELFDAAMAKAGKGKGAGAASVCDNHAHGTAASATGSKCLKIYMRNITRWGPKVLEHLKSQWQAYDVVGLCEHHTGPADINNLGDNIAKAGWRPVISPAMPRDHVLQAGTLIAAKRGLNAHSFSHLAAHASQCYGTSHGVQALSSLGSGPIDFHDFSAVSVRTSWQQIVLVQIYLDHGIGVKGRNLRKLRALGGFLSAQAAPWIAFGDWNVEPNDLDDWLEKVVGTQLLPENVEVTSFAGEGRLYDFAVCAKDLAPFIRSVRSVMDGEWKAHAALQINIGLDPADAEHLT
ncbi:unnamed protein product, partial [Prorocentrum cordatum]